jgi:hypothetical protein
MTAGSVLPVTIHKGQLLFLFGKENDMEDSAKGFSDFGGSVEDGESIQETAMREGGEELTGFLGDSNQLKKHIKSHGGIFKIQHNKYHIHLFYLPYDENLPKYYNLNHQFLWNRMDRGVLNKTKLFEKIEIQWFSPSMIHKRIKEFRPFYQEIVRHVLSKSSKIKKFIHKCSRKTIKKSSIFKKHRSTIKYKNK